MGGNADPCPVVRPHRAQSLCQELYICSKPHSGDCRYYCFIFQTRKRGLREVTDHQNSDPPQAYWVTILGNQNFQLASQVILLYNHVGNHP